ncbi:MAG: hypothetical protein LQ351_006916 [Letrouitia transgressa]|nr:MAG: hypothetical protein LQ351_006916 [Letrouitia transgressa]
MTPTSSLSIRGRALDSKGGVMQRFKAVLADPYDAEKNPGGLVNIGTSENLQLGAYEFSYGPGPTGSPRLLKAMAAHINRYFHPNLPVEPEQLRFTNGITSLSEMLAFAICDAGDYLLLSRPSYQAFSSDWGTRADVKCEYVSFGDTDQFSTDGVPAYREAILSARQAGNCIRALILCNPHNPLGKCYTKDALIGTMRLCNEYQIHLVMDEVYALSVYDVPDKHAVPFTSALSLPTDKYIDPNYFHHIYSFSKDFAAGGIRLGCCYTRNEELNQALDSIVFFGASGNINELAGCLILEDQDYLSHFLDLSKKRLSENNVLTRELLDKHGIDYYKGANAGFFLWINLRPWLPEIDEAEDAWKAEDSLTQKLLENQVYITNGKALNAEEPGWYRLIFAQDAEIVKLGIER